MAVAVMGATGLWVMKGQQRVTPKSPLLRCWNGVWIISEKLASLIKFA
jgi:hypothetical protein